MTSATIQLYLENNIRTKHWEYGNVNPVIIKMLCVSMVMKN